MAGLYRASATRHGQVGRSRVGPSQDPYPDGMDISALRIFTEPQQGATYDDLLAVATAAERLGFGAFFRSDHYLKMGSVDGLPGPTDAWTTLAGLARDTASIRLGTLVTSATFRHPGPLAISVAQVDHMSGGRVELGLGAGWYEHEWRAYGYGFPGVGDRISALRDGVQIIQRLWAEGEATLESQTFSVDGAICRPQPLQRGRDGRPRIPTWIAGGGEQRTLRYAAKWADATNFGGSPEQFARKRDVLLGHLDKEGRDPAEVRLTSNLNVVVRETEAEARRVVDEVNARADSAMPAEHAGTGFSTRGAVVGTPQQVVDHVGALREAGLGTLIAYMPEVAFEQDGIALFERDVMAALA